MSDEKRFTIDGSAELEAHLAETCRRVCLGVRGLVAARRLEALVLGGGYGRGQGGVWRTAQGDRPYNDLEFYVFLRGSRLLNERRYGPALQGLAEALSAAAGLHVEFKVDSLRRLRRNAITMFSYDLVSGHRILHGGPEIFRGCEHHRKGSELPLVEATRLLFNRCTGLLLARELLSKTELTPGDEDFVSRNLAKGRLALGDALLTALGAYHWSCLERRERLARLEAGEPMPWLEDLRKDHAAGVEFKLHPEPASKTPAEFSAEHRRLCGLAGRLWLWLENRRLGRGFASAQDYALSGLAKCPGTPAWRNWMLSLRTFGPGAMLDLRSWRYPRERLFNCLPLLMGAENVAVQASVVRHLQRQLHTQAADWLGLVNAYKRVWTRYG